MFPNIYSDVVTLDNNRFGSIRHRICGQLPEEWQIKEVPPGLGLLGHQYIVGLGPPDATTEPIIAIRYFGKVDDIDSLVSLALNSRIGPGVKANPKFIPVPAHSIKGVQMRRLSYIDVNTQMLINLCVRNGVGYGVELWTQDIGRYLDIFDEFVESLDWNYRHLPRTIDECFATESASQQEAEEELGLFGKIISLVITAALAYLVFRIFRP